MSCKPYQSIITILAISLYTSFGCTNPNPNLQPATTPSKPATTAIPTPSDCKEAADKTGNFFKCPDGSIYDKAGELFWAASDNGNAVSYDVGVNYLATYRGGGWRMPSVEELKMLYAAKITSEQGGSLITVPKSNYVWADHNKEPTTKLDYDCQSKNQRAENICLGSALGTLDPTWAFAFAFKEDRDLVFRDQRGVLHYVLPVRRASPVGP